MKRRRQRGNSIIEFTLMTPWLIFLFIGAMDWGFYADALIATEAAARVACLYASTSSSILSSGTVATTACTNYVLGQLKRMPNVNSTVTTCVSGTGVTASAPVGITVSSVTGPDSMAAAQVTVTYLTPILIPVIGSGSLPKQLTISRTITMRVRG